MTGSFSELAGALALGLVGILLAMGLVVLLPQMDDLAYSVFGAIGGLSGLLAYVCLSSR